MSSPIHRFRWRYIHSWTCTAGSGVLAKLIAEYYQARATPGYDIFSSAGVLR